MNRRTFLKALGGGVVAGAAVPFLPIPAPPVAVQALAFHPEAFAMTMAPLKRVGNTLVTPDWVVKQSAAVLAKHTHRIGHTIDVRLPERYRT